MAGLTWRGTRSSGWRAASAAALLAALLSPAAPAAANHGQEAGMAVATGWPQRTTDLAGGASMNIPIEGSTGKSGWFKHSSPTLADLDGNGTLEIVIGSLDGRVYAYQPDGTLLPGWPRLLATPSIPPGPVNGTPAVGDIDGDGRPDVVVGSDNGWVFAFSATGQLKPGWPQFTGTNSFFPGQCEVHACTGVVAGPTLADLDADGREEIIAGSLSHRMWVWRGDGSVLPGWPRNVWGPIATSAAIGDLDGDRSPEIVVASDVRDACGNCPPYGSLAPGGLLHAFRTDGSELPGWPRPTDSFMTSSPVLADLDGDRMLEALVGGGPFTSDQHVRGHHVTAYRADGSVMWRFTTPAGASNDAPGGIVAGHIATVASHHSYPAEVAFTDTAGVVRLLRPDGTLLWARSASPVGGPNGPYLGGPVLGDVTGDTVADVVAADAFGAVRAWSRSGDLVADSTLLGPGVTRYAVLGSPAVGRLFRHATEGGHIVVGSAAGDGPSGPDAAVAAGVGELWVFTSRGGAGVAGAAPQFQSRVVPEPYWLYDPCVTPAHRWGPLPAPLAAERTAVFRDGRWYLRNSLTSGPGDRCNVFGQPGDLPAVGDFNNDRADTLGLFRPAEGRWFLSNHLERGRPDGFFSYGSPGDLPVVGDWNDDGTDTLGVFRPSEGRWYLSNFFDRGVADGVFRFGSPGDIPVVGDWNNDGTDTIGIFRPSEGRWYLSNFFDRGSAEIVFTFGQPGDLPVVGDWNGDGFDTIGVFRPAEGRWYLSDGLGPVGALPPFSFGGPEDRPMHWG